MITKWVDSQLMSNGKQYENVLFVFHNGNLFYKKKLKSWSHGIMWEPYKTGPYFRPADRDKYETVFSTKN